MKFILWIALSTGIATSLSAAQVSMVVTAEPQHGTAPALIDRQDVTVLQDKQRLPVLDWVPLRGDQAALQLYILIDDGLSASFSNQFGDLRQFIANQPATTEIGIGSDREEMASFGCAPGSAPHLQRRGPRLSVMGHERSIPDFGGPGRAARGRHRVHDLLG